MNEGLIEQLAQVIHSRYLERHEGERATSPRPSLRPWAELDDGLRESNRDQARAIESKLRSIGCCIEPGPAAAGTAFEFDAAELDTLSKVEHDRYTAERLAAGWVPGPERDDAHKIDPCLVGWEALPEFERDKDREAVLAIPAVLAVADLHVTRRP